MGTEFEIAGAKVNAVDSPHGTDEKGNYAYVATVPTPVVIGDGRIFFSGGYNSGSMMMRLKD